MLDRILEILEIPLEEKSRYKFKYLLYKQLIPNRFKQVGASEFVERWFKDYEKKPPVGEATEILKKINFNNPYNLGVLCSYLERGGNLKQRRMFSEGIKGIIDSSYLELPLGNLRFYYELAKMNKEQHQSKIIICRTLIANAGLLAGRDTWRKKAEFYNKVLDQGLIIRWHTENFMFATEDIRRKILSLGKFPYNFIRSEHTSKLNIIGKKVEDLVINR